MYSICHYWQESFKTCREIFGIENESPSGNNDVNDKNKTITTMEKTTTYNDAILEAEIQAQSKNQPARLI